MSENPTVSVIMPVYNVEKYLDGAVRDVQAQGIEDYEIILSDDASTDSSGRMCDEWARRDSRIKVVHHENGGCGYARNFGLDMARGRYVYFMDPDDNIDSGLLAENIAIAEKYGCDEVIFCYRSVLEENRGTGIAEGTVMHGMDGLVTADEFKSRYMDYFRNIPNCVWNRIYRRAAIGDIRFEKIFVIEDALFNLELLKKRELSIYYNNKCYYTYYTRRFSLINRYEPKRFECDALAFEKMRSLAKKWGESEEFGSFINEKYAQSAAKEYQNLSLKDCTLSRKEKIRHLRNIFGQVRMKEAIGKVEAEKLSSFISRLCVRLSKGGHYALALAATKAHISAAVPLKRLLRKIRR